MKSIKKINLKLKVIIEEIFFYSYFNSCRITPIKNLIDQLLFLKMDNNI